MASGIAKVQKNGLTFNMKCWANFGRVSGLTGKHDPRFFEADRSPDSPVPPVTFTRTPHTSLALAALRIPVCFPLLIGIARRHWWADGPNGPGPIIFGSRSIESKPKSSRHHFNSTTRSRLASSSFTWQEKLNFVFCLHLAWRMRDANSLKIWVKRRKLLLTLNSQSDSALAQLGLPLFVSEMFQIESRQLKSRQNETLSIKENISRFNTK